MKSDPIKLLNDVDLNARKFGLNWINSAIKLLDNPQSGSADLLFQNSDEYIRQRIDEIGGKSQSKTALDALSESAMEQGEYWILQARSRLVQVRFETEQYSQG